MGAKLPRMREYEGTIRSMELINFMCHSHLVINLNKPLTVITGCNGSGKSAIMIALGIALGQRAQHLERGNSFKDMIKSKESVAVVRIVLNNHRGFKKDFFGNTIVVEKRICTRSSTISVMSGERRIWSMKKEDLELMLDFFSMRFENPLNFLTQEQAKKFLNLTQPEVLYELFMKGTEIEEIRRLNEESVRNVNEMMKRIEGINQELDAINERMKKEKDSLNVVNSIKMMEEELRSMEKEVLWSKLKEDGMRVEESFERLKAKQGELDEYNRRSCETARVLEGVREEINNAEDEEAERRRIEGKRKQEIEAEIKKLEMRCREMGNDVMEIREIKGFKDKIIADFERQSGPVKDLSPQLEEKRERIAVETKALIERLEALNKDGVNYERMKKEEDEMVTEHESRMYQLRKHVEFYSKNDQNALLSPSLPQVMSAISKTKFVGKVIGPLAFGIKLKEQKWGKAASIILNNHLTTFIVLNRQDKARLLGIFRRFRVDFPISTPSSTVPRAVNYKRNISYKTLLDALEIEDPFVLNHLIITCSIEQIILVEDRKEAYGIVRANPLFVECAYTRNGDRIKLVGGSLSDFVTRGIDKFYFENTQHMLEMCRSKLRNLQDKKIERVAENKLQEIKDEMKKISGSIEFNERADKTLRMEIEDAKQMYESQLKAVHNEGLYEEVRSLEHRAMLLEGKQKEIIEKVDVLKKEMEKLGSSKMNEIMRLRTEMNKYVQEDKVLKKEIELCRKDLLELEERHQKNVECYNSEKDLLLKNGGEVLSPRPEAEIRERMVQIRTCIEMSSTVDEREVLETLELLCDLKRRNQDLVVEYKDKIARSLEDVNLRVLKRDTVRNEIADRAVREFSDITKSRGYEGKLEFNHEAKTLDIRMKVHGHKNCGSKNTLSGGERSFAGVSLLLSLWPSLCCPVKVLDEFDVFMDSLNRKHVLDLFLNFFRKKRFQAILITPLNIEDLFEDFCDVVVLDKPSTTSDIKN